MSSFVIINIFLSRKLKMNVDRVTKYDPLKVGATDILENKIHYTESSSRSSFPVVAKCINQLFMFFF